MKSFCPSAIFDYLGGQLGDKRAKICKYRS